MKLKKVVKFFSKWQVQLIILLAHILLSVVGFYNFVFNYHLSEVYLVQSVNEKQQIISKSGARSVENFLHSIDNQLSSFVFSFAKIDGNTAIDKEATRQQFAEFIKRSKPPISGIALYDESGTLIIIENKEHNKLGEGVDFSSRDFITWSTDPLNKGKSFITNPYISASGSTQGQNIMAIVTPIYFGNKFKGTLAIRFLVNQFKDAFINPLATAIDEDSFIIDNNNVVIAGDVGLLNKNLNDYARQSKWHNYTDFNDKLNAVLKKDSTNTSWNFAFPNQKVKNYLVASSKIDLPNTDKDLYLILLTPQSGTLKPLSPLRYYGTVWIWISIILTFLGGVIYIVVKRLSKESV